MNEIVSTQIVGGNPTQQRSKSDFYPTPPEVTQALIDVLAIPEGSQIWEPACGDGDMVSVLRNNGFEVTGTDIRYDEDFLESEVCDFDWIITNPPFSLAEQFIRRSAYFGKPFAMLLKNQFWNARKRVDLFNEITPSRVMPLTWRPDFLFKKHEKGSPLMDVMWCVWEPQYQGLPKFMPLVRNNVTEHP